MYRYMYSSYDIKVYNKTDNGSKRNALNKKRCLSQFPKNCLIINLSDYVWRQRKKYIKYTFSF